MFASCSCVCSSSQGIDALVRVSEGDLRKAITLLQSAARLGAEKEITESIVIEIAGVRPRLRSVRLLITLRLCSSLQT